MAQEGKKTVEVAFDAEIEAPPSIYPSLPDTLSLVVFLGAERRVPEILNQESDPAVSCPLDRERGLRVVLEEASGVEGPHLLLSQLLGFPVKGLDHLFCR